VHSTEKPFACPEPGCTYRAKLRKHIAAHLRTSVHAPQAPTTAAEPLCLPWLLPHVLQPLALDEQWSLQPDAQERQRTALFRQVLNNTARETFCETPTPQFATTTTAAQNGYMQTQRWSTASTILFSMTTKINICKTRTSPVSRLRVSLSALSHCVCARTPASTRFACIATTFGMSFLLTYFCILKNSTPAGSRR